MAEQPGMNDEQKRKEQEEKGKQEPTRMPGHFGRRFWHYARLLVTLGLVAAWAVVFITQRADWSVKKHIIFALPFAALVLLLTRLLLPHRYGRPDHWFHSFGQLVVAGVLILGAVTGWHLVDRRQDWPLGKHIVFAAPFILGVVMIVLFWVLMRRKDKLRKDFQADNPDDPNALENILIVYKLSNKALYYPTIIASLLMAWLLALDIGCNPKTLGGIWLAIFFANFLVEEYDVDLRVVLITLFGIAAVLLWVGYMEWMREFRQLFEKFAISLDAPAFLLIAIIFFLAILYSWFKGQFVYVAITPNDINIQTGITETGEQLGPQAYNTKVVAGDLLERLFLFGRIVITFRDTRRPPMDMLVWDIATKAKKLEKIRAVLLVDTQDQ